MTFGTALGKLALPAYLLFDTRARDTINGLRLLRRAHEHVLVMAALEGADDTARPYCQAYIDALEILGARALLVAKTL
ncbi:MAG: hypothetical protein WA510_12540 [Acidobacteriaceae bacterium]